jgi:hypothetical protein
MRTPTHAVNISWARAGEIADVPANITNVEMAEDDETIGLLSKWSEAAEWIWADYGSFVSLEETR